MWAWLGALYVVAVTIQLALGLRVVSPWIMVDELVYSDMARSFANTGHFLIRGAHANYGPVYSLLLSPAYALFGSISDVYEWARLFNALAMCSVVFPAYLLARRVVRPGFALAAAALAVAIPSTIYIGTLMTENVFYPVFLWLAYALVLALERPTLKRQLVVLALCALAFFTRAQAVALFAAVLTAPLALAWIERGRPRRLAAWKPTYALVVAAGVLVIVVEAVRGRSPSQVLGGYSVTTTSASYQVWPAVRWILYHVAALDLSLFVLPFAALIVLDRECAPSRCSAPRVLRGGRDADRLAHDRGRCLRVALVAPHRGAKPLLRRAALPDRVARLDRARANRGQRVQSSPPPASRLRCRARSRSSG